MIVLGVDIGGTKTHAALANEKGDILAFHTDKRGNPEIDGFEHLKQLNTRIVTTLCHKVGIGTRDIDAAIFGIAGFDWDSQNALFQSTINHLGLPDSTLILNDAFLGLAERDLGVCLIAGTSFNCRGINRAGKIGRVIGDGMIWGEAAGAIEIVTKAIQAVCAEWTQRGQPTQLTQALLDHYQCQNIDQLIEDLVLFKHHIDPAFAKRVFDLALAQDAVAQSIIEWAGQELGSLAVGVIHQLELNSEHFDVVLAGSLFKVGDMLTRPVARTIHKVAPHARLIPLITPPVAGAISLAIKKSGYKIDTALSEHIMENISNIIGGEFR